MTPDPSWVVYASCSIDDLDELARLCATGENVKYVCDGGCSGSGFLRHGVVSVRFVPSTTTLVGVGMEGQTILARHFGPSVYGIEVLTLLREADGAIFDAAQV